jgi:inhibitor of cysteine peptidase
MGRGVIVAAVALAIGIQAAAAETLRLAPGKSVRVELTENPSTGYGWRINAPASAGLDRIRISDEGYAPGADMPGAPGRHLWTIHGVAPGKATIQFDYQRPWESTPVQSRRVDVVIRAR